MELRALTERAYHWNAGDYARHSTAQFEWARELSAKLTLHGSESLLDIGCGDGKVTAALAERLPRGQGVGIDNSDGMVALAGQTFRARNLAFCRMDARHLAFAGAFDVAFSNAALHWVRDHLSVLSGVARALRPSGQVLFQMGGRGNARDLVAVFQAVLAREPWRQYFIDFSFPYWFYGPEEYAALLGQAGLRAERLELIPKDMRQPGRAGLANWIRTAWLPYTELVPADQRETFISEVADAYLEVHPLDEAGEAHVQMVRLEVAATRG